MDNHDSAVSVYAEAKGEYTKQLTLFIVPTFHRFFMTCLQQASEEETNQKRQLWKFQELLSQIPEWNVDKVQREVQKFTADIQCDYLEELVTAVFIAHTKVLTAIRIGNKNKRVQITIPKLDHFLHRALSECSRLLWSSAFLFHNELSPIEKQKNHRQIEGLLHEGIGQAIRGLLPVKNILKDYLAEPDHEDEDEEKEDKEEKEEEKEDKEEKEEKEEKEAKEEEKEKEKEEEKEEKEKKEEKNEEKVELPEIIDVITTVPDVATEPVVSVTKEEKSATAEPIPSPAAPTFIVDTEPTVRFTNYDQVIQKSGDLTNINYVESTANSSEDIEFADDSREPLSDFEDLTQYPSEPLLDGDFETL